MPDFNHLNWSDIRDWLLLIAVLAGLLYTAWIIKAEKKTYLKHAKSFSLQNFELKVPHWWSPLKSNTTCLQFHRADTRYDWLAEFKFLDSPKSTLEEVLADELKRRRILFDADCSITQQADLILNQADVIDAVESILRAEGTATEADEDRLYLDIVLIRFVHSPQIFALESKSSVLNGSVEGPYFEEVLERLCFKA